MLELIKCEFLKLKRKKFIPLIILEMCIRDSVLSAIEGQEKRPGHSERKISLAVDIQAKLAAVKGPGYERWAKVFNLSLIHI